MLNRNKKEPQPQPEAPGVHPLPKREHQQQADEWDDDDDDPKEGPLLTLVTDQDEVIVGLKVYTHKECPAVVYGRLRSDFNGS